MDFSSSWLSELELDGPFWNDEFAMMGFEDDELSAFGEDHLLPSWSPQETAPDIPTLNIPTNGGIPTASLSVLSAMKAPAIPSSSMPLTNLIPNQDNPARLSEDNPQGSLILNSQDTASKCGRKPEKSGRRVRPASQSYDHIVAERKRRELLGQRFAALSALVPGLKKMDKTSVLGDAISYLKGLQERVKILEEVAAKKSTESVILVRRSHVWCEDNPGSSDVISDDQGKTLPEVEAKVCNKNILLRVQCEKKTGVLVKLLSEVMNLNLAVLSTSVAPFGSFALDVTITAAMESEVSVTVPELIRRIRSAIQDGSPPAYKENYQGSHG